MSLAQRFERRLEGLVGGAFARVFKGQVEPVEIGSALQREAADKRNVMGSGQVLAPNRYRVTLAPSDYERLVPWELQLTNSLAELVQEYLDENSWNTIGDIEVYLARDDQLHTGVFGVASRMESQAPPRRRPQDSLSMPAIPGVPIGEYPAQYLPQSHGAQGAGAQGAGGHGAGGHGAGVPGAGVAGAGMAGAVGAAAGALGPQYPLPPQQHFNPPTPPQQHYAPPADQQYGPPAPQYAPPVEQQYAPPAEQYAPPQPSYQPQPAPPSYGQPAQPPAPPATGRRTGAAVVVDQTNQRFELRVGSNVVGRGTDSDLQLLDQGISRRHLDIQYDGNFATVYDLGSTNGTSVNGHEVGSQLLRHGDVIRIGHTRLVFQQERA